MHHLAIPVIRDNQICGQFKVHPKHPMGQKSLIVSCEGTIEFSWLWGQNMVCEIFEKDLLVLFSERKPVAKKKWLSTGLR